MRNLPKLLTQIGYAEAMWSIQDSEELVVHIIAGATNKPSVLLSFSTHHCGSDKQEEKNNQPTDKLSDSQVSFLHAFRVQKQSIFK